MKTEELNKKLALLETQNDFLTTEIEQLDQLMRNLGFSDGIATVKATAKEILSASDEF